MKEKNLVSVEKMSVYNRWGNQVYTFSTSDNQRYPNWDGKLDGNEELPADVYTYIYEIKYKDGKTVKGAGDVTLLR
jgi:gliding motility-associated-like protein